MIASCGLTDKGGNGDLAAIIERWPDLPDAESTRFGTSGAIDGLTVNASTSASL